MLQYILYKCIGNLEFKWNRGFFFIIKDLAVNQIALG